MLVSHGRASEISLPSLSNPYHSSMNDVEIIDVDTIEKVEV
jgi:hypothetical protein